MIVAREKRNTNIAEYILYMWQIEDIIRAHNFDLERIKLNLVSQYHVPENVKTEIMEWYSGIADSMLQEGIRHKGHLQYLVSLVDDLNDFHFRLIDSSFQPVYQKTYESVVRNISEFRLRMGQIERISDMEVCLTALYGILLMKLKKSQISEDTLEVTKSFSQLLAQLSELFRKFEEGSLEI